MGFTDAEISACAARSSLLAIEIALPGSGECGCDVCTADSTANRPVLSLAELMQCIDQAHELGAQRLILIDRDDHSFPELKSILDYAHERRMEIELFTTCSNISESVASLLCARDVAVVLKLDSPAAASSANAAIEVLRPTGYDDSKRRLAVAAGIYDENVESLPEFWRWARQNNIEPYVHVVTPRRQQAAGAAPISSERGRALFNELERIDRLEFGLAWPADPWFFGRSCKRHQYACHVSECGYVFPCVGVTIPIGNIRAEPLQEILHLSDVMENLRDYPGKLKEPCRTCSKTVDCYGCRGSAFQLTGDYLAGDQLCWKATGLEFESLPANVENYIPHGPSIRVVDQLVQIGERRARTQMVVRSDSPLVDSAGRLDELAYVEMIAQSFASSHGYEITAEERQRERGLLLGVKNLVVSGEAYVDDQLTIDIQKVTRFGDFGVVEGQVRHHDGRLVASGQLKIWRSGKLQFDKEAT